MTEIQKQKPTYNMSRYSTAKEVPVETKTPEPHHALVRIGLGDHVMTLPVVQLADSVPNVVTMTDLGQRAGELIEQVESGVPALVTKRGKFVAVIVPVDTDDVESALFDRIAERVTRETSNLAAEPLLLSVSDVARRLGLVDPSIKK